MMCPLCDCENISFMFHQKHFSRDFYCCTHCELHFVDPRSLLSNKDEKERYSHHKNSKRDPGYVAFLSKLLNPILSLVNKNDCGLDFGSGPYPMLQELAIEKGFDVKIYDPFFANNKHVLDKTYDYVTCCEVVEHFHNPSLGFQSLVQLLRSGAYLGIMTSILSPDIDFKNWHYIKDDTHVSLYTPKTLEWISENFGIKIIYQKGNVTIFQSLVNIKG